MSGRLAQLVRAAALHAVGQGFESLVAHSKPACEAGFFMPVSPITIHVLPVVQNTVLLSSTFRLPG